MFDSGCGWWYCVSAAEGPGCVHCAHLGQTYPTQVSWSLDHKSAHAGTYEVRFFDEESYSLLRKVSISDPEPCPGLQEGGCTSLPRPPSPCSASYPSSRPLGALPSQRRLTQGRGGGVACLPDHLPRLCSHLPRFSLARLFRLPWLGPTFLPVQPLPTLPGGTPDPNISLQAQRNNEDISIIPPLFTVSVDHRVSVLKRPAGLRGSREHATSLALFEGWGRAGRGSVCLRALEGRWPGLAGSSPFSPLRWLWSPFLQGTWNGPWVSTEVLAAAIGLVIYYLAFSAKSHIQA